jgi:hypothetical protein
VVHYVKYALPAVATEGGFSAAGSAKFGELDTGVTTPAKGVIFTGVFAFFLSRDVVLHIVRGLGPFDNSQKRFCHQVADHETLVTLGAGVE